jgi:hypothetical protein
MGHTRAVSVHGAAAAEAWRVDVAGDRVERLMTEILDRHWRDVTVGPLIEGSAWEVRFTAPPKLSIRDGYLTVDTGAWHFHLCVNDHAAAPTPERAARRRVARAEFYREPGESCVPMTWGLRLWNGHGEQMVTVLFPNPHFDPDGGMLAEPRWERVALWDDLRRRYADAR